MCKKRIVKVLIVAVLLSAAALAEVDESGRLIVPESSVAPVIDGVLDEVWQNVGEEGVLITEIINTTSAVPEDANDLSATFQVMYKDDNFYIYVVVQDSVLDYTFSDWQGDGVELFFDGDNSKGSSYDSVNDNQIRITVDDVELADIDSSLPVEGTAFSVLLTDVGYNIEASFPLSTLQIIPENTFGFEVQINDNDDGSGRETMIRWFSNDNDSWRDASLFGEAVLVPEPEPVDPGSDGLVAYYALENDVNDSSGNGNDGTIVGNPTWIPGAQGTALEFHGLGAAGGGGDYIDCGSDASLDVTGPISLALWIRPDANDPEGQGTTTALMAKAMSGIGWSWQVRYGWNSPQPYMAFTFNTSPRAWAYVGQNLVQGEWCHIACSHDGATLKCYLDGEQTDSTPMGAITSSEAPVLIGSDGWGCDWIGGIDEVAMYNRGLSDGEILYLAGERVPVDPGIENLMAYYPLDNDANDVSANNNHGTLSGDPQWVSGAIGEALEFDGIDDHVDCGNDPSLDITGPITIGAWVYPTGPGSSSYPRIVDKSDGTGGADPGYKLYLRSADNYLVTLSAGGAYLNSSISATLDDWNYVALVTDGTQRKLFLNGVWEVWDESALPVSSSNPLFIGDSPAGSRPLQGRIDEVTIYNRALSEPEVRFIAGER